MKSILPKLAMALQQLVIDPTSQDLAPFEWVMAWHHLLPVQQMTSLLEQSFFPKWHKVLDFWLSHSPDYDEVNQSMAPQSISHPKNPVPPFAV